MLIKASPITSPLYVNDVFKAIVLATNTELRSDANSWLTVNNKKINFQYGDRDEINKQMSLLRQGNATKNTLSPFVGLVMPYQQKKGDEYKSYISFPQIIIASVTGANDSYDSRYQNFIKPVLYPIYTELLNQFVKVANITNYGDSTHLPHTLMEVPNISPKDTGLNDYLDALVLLNLEVTFINSQINSF